MGALRQRHPNRMPESCLCCNTAVTVPGVLYRRSQVTAQPETAQQQEIRPLGLLAQLTDCSFLPSCGLELMVHVQEEPLGSEGSVTARSKDMRLQVRRRYCYCNYPST
eukprot:364899-Chlamydomonas_euryale.AAC.15